MHLKRKTCGCWLWCHEWIVMWCLEMSYFKIRQKYPSTLFIFWALGFQKESNEAESVWLTIMRRLNLYCFPLVLFHLVPCNPLPHGLTFCSWYFVMSSHIIGRGRAVAIPAGIVVDYLVEFPSSVWKSGPNQTGVCLSLSSSGGGGVCGNIRHQGHSCGPEEIC